MPRALPCACRPEQHAEGAGLAVQVVQPTLDGVGIESIKETDRISW
jgi:hypothetical protein